MHAFLAIALVGGVVILAWDGAFDGAGRLRDAARRRWPR